MRLIKVRVTPGSKKDEVVSKGEDSFDIKTRAESERGEANDAVVVLLAHKLDVDPKKIRIIKGHRSHSKIIEIWQ